VRVGLQGGEQTRVTLPLDMIDVTQQAPRNQLLGDRNIATRRIVLQMSSLNIAFLLLNRLRVVHKESIVITRRQIGDVEVPPERLVMPDIADLEAGNFLGPGSAVEHDEWNPLRGFAALPLRPHMLGEDGRPKNGLQIVCTKRLASVTALQVLGYLDAQGGHARVLVEHFLADRNPVDRANFPQSFG
jgi:hypothetical protein